MSFIGWWIGPIRKYTVCLGSAGALGDSKGMGGDDITDLVTLRNTTTSLPIPL